MQAHKYFVPITKSRRRINKSCDLRNIQKHTATQTRHKLLHSVKCKSTSERAPQVHGTHFRHLASGIILCIFAKKANPCKLIQPPSECVDLAALDPPSQKNQFSGGVQMYRRRVINERTAACWHRCLFSRSVTLCHIHDTPAKDPLHCWSIRLPHAFALLRRVLRGGFACGRDAMRGHAEHTQETSERERHVITKCSQPGTRGF